MSQSGKAKELNGGVTTPSRRGFVAALAAGLGVPLNLISHGDLLAAEPPNCSKAGDAFVPVPEVVSKGNKLAANMTVRSAEKSVATIAGQGYQCRSMKLRYYEVQEAGSSTRYPANPALPGPGPTFRLKVGDQVQIK